MAIKPIGNAMTIQSQSMQRQVVRRPAVENKEVLESASAVNVDATTASVPKVENGEQQKATQERGDQQSSQQLANDQIKKTVDRLKQNISNSEAIFGIHEETKRVTIKIVDKDTKEVIKELPPEKTLDMISKVWELAGILVDERR